MKITEYEIKTNKIKCSVTLAVISDLHSRPYQNVFETVKSISPDAILLPGDIVEVATEYMEERNKNGLEFLKMVSTVAPTYYCYGNHEIYNSHAKKGESKSPDKALSDTYLNAIRAYGVHVINDTYETLTVTDPKENKVSILLGGIVCGRDMDPALASPLPDLDLLKQFDLEEGFKILLCHYPHYFDKFIRSTSIDLTLSGHAHGGQWQFFGKGVYAPHQGLFPKFTHGIHEGRHIISRGAANNVKPIPRFFNPCEILKVKIIGI